MHGKFFCLFTVYEPQCQMQIPQRDKWRMYETISNMSVCLPLMVLFVGIMERLRGGRAGIDKEALFHTNLIPLCQYTDNASNGVCKRVKVTYQSLGASSLRVRLVIRQTQAARLPPQRRRLAGEAAGFVPSLRWQARRHSNLKPRGEERRHLIKTKQNKKKYFRNTVLILN